MNRKNSTVLLVFLVFLAGCGIKKQVPQQKPIPVKKQKNKKPRRSWWRRHKKVEPVVVQPVIAPLQDQQKERDQKISALCKQFIDVENKELNWTGFCEKMSGYIKDDPTLTELCEVLNTIKDSKSAMSACWKLKPHLKKLPPVVYAEFENFSVSKLLNLVSTRMKQEA